MVREQGTHLPPRLLPLYATLSRLPLTDRCRVLGTLLLGAPGTGKTLLLSLYLLVDLLRGLPGCVIDPLGTLSEAFLFRLLWFVSAFPPGEAEFLRRRLRYFELGGESITPFPIYYQRDGESLWDAGQRLITVLERASPQLTTAPLTWPAARRLGVNAGMLLTALGYQLTKGEDLLFHTIEWDNAGTFQEAVNRNPQATDAVSYFRDYYLLLPRSEQRRIAGTFLDQVSFLSHSPTLRNVFAGASTPGIAWEEAGEAYPQLVLINCKGITDPASRSFALHWILENLLSHLKQRGRRKTPFVLTVDEFANLAASGTTENKPVAVLFDELLAQYARNNNILVTAALQSIDQVDQRVGQTLLRLGTIISGRAGTPREARALADVLYQKDIYRIHHHNKKFGKVDPPPFSRGVGYYPAESLSVDKRSPYYPYYILDQDPQYMGLDLQEADAAGRIHRLGALEFLCRPAIRDGDGDVIPVFLADAISDPDTGAFIFPDPEQDARLIARVQRKLAARSGIPGTDSRQERKSDCQTLLTDGSSQNLPQPHLAPDAGERQPVTLPTGRQPAQQTLKQTPSLPTLDEHQHQFLSFVSSNRGTPVAMIYKALGIRSVVGTSIRERLQAQGLIAELAVRMSSATGGRPAKCIIPTFAGLKLAGKEPPPGRGGSVHKYIQERVIQGALAKGYSAEVEHKLASGAIVDVHLEKGAGLPRIAVEIAIVSDPLRESSHIRSCLASGYDQVFTLFADEKLMARVAANIEEILSPEEQQKVRLLPLRQVAAIG